MAYERVMRGDSCYQVTCGPSFVLVYALTGLAWTSEQHTHRYMIPNDELRPAEEWQAHLAADKEV